MEITQSVKTMFTLAGRQDAFSLISRGCTAATAECLRQIRDAKSYEEIGLTWDQFCHDHLGISRGHADRLIRHLAELGAKYFAISGIVPISPETYRQIESHVTSAGIEIDGETVPLIPANAPKIRAAIQDLRAQLRKAERKPNLTVPLQFQLNAILAEMRRRMENPSPSDVIDLRLFVNSALDDLYNLGQDLEQIAA